MTRRNRDILRLFADGMRQSDIARRFGISPSRVKEIIIRDRFRRRGGGAGAHAGELPKVGPAASFDDRSGRRLPGFAFARAGLLGFFFFGAMDALRQQFGWSPNAKE